MSAMRDLRREHFSDLPEPRKEETKVAHVIADSYMGTIEKYIERLSERIRQIQDEERGIMNDFSATLHLMKDAKTTHERRAREDAARELYQKKIGKIRDKRRKYREMLYDAYTERKKLIDSMQIQRDEDDILRRKLAKLNALSAGETSREQRKTSLFDKFALLFMVVQIILIIIFGLTADYTQSVEVGPTCADYAGRLHPVAPYYQFYTDVALFALVGMGFLLAYLRKYQYSAVGFTLLTVAVVFQWTIVVSQFFRKAASGVWQDYEILQTDLIMGMYGAVTVLISFGAMAGIVSAFQLLIIALIEVVLYGLNIYLATTFFETYNNWPADSGNAALWGDFGFGGEATFVHVFGAFFGLAVAFPLGRRVAPYNRGVDDRTDSYSSDMFAMIGTIFMWVLFPSFNAALVPSIAQHRVVANTVLSLCASVVFAALSSRVFRGGKFDIVDVQNASLAGGVAMGTSASLLITPGAAMIVGAVAAICSALGFAFVMPMFVKWNITDTRGVFALHAIPGLIAALTAVVSLAIAFDNNAFIYGTKLTELFPAGVNTSGWYLLSVIVTLALAIIPGLALGWFMSRFTSPKKRLYSDEGSWKLPSDFELHAAQDDVEPAKA